MGLPLKIAVATASLWYWCWLFFSETQNLVQRIVVAKQNSDPTSDDDEEFIAETREVSPAHFLTKIELFSLFSKYGIKKYETREFDAGDYKWRLIIYPDGHRQKKEKGNHISIYLAMGETSSLPEDWEFNATFTIFLYNQIQDNYLCFRVNGRRFNKTKSIWGFPKFISKKSLRDESKGYLVDDNFVLGAEVFVLKRQRVVERVTLLKPIEYPQKREWMIQEFSKLKDSWFSEVFTIRDVNWKMKLELDGHNSKGCDLSMFLVCVGCDSFAAHQKVKAEFDLRVKGRPIDQSIKLDIWFTSSIRGWGVDKFVSRDALLDSRYGFIVDDCLTIEVEIQVQVVV